MVRQKKSWIKELIISAVLFGIFFLIYLVRSHYDLRLWDEGYNACIAERVYDGQVPYRDFYLVYSPGRFFIQALMFKIFGVTLAVERAYTIIVIALFAVISYLLGRQLKINPWLSIWLTILASHNSTSIFITPSIDRILFSFIAILGMILYDKTEKKGWLIGAGFLCAMNILIGQETGAYTLAVLILFLCWRVFILSQKKLKEKGLMLIGEMGLFICGIFIGTIPFVIYTLFQGSLGDTLQVLFIDPVIYAGHKPNFYNFLKIFEYYFKPMHLRLLIYFNRFFLAVIISIGTLFFLFAKIIYKKEIVREDGYLLMLSLFGLFLGAALILFFTPHHLLILLPPIYIMAMLYFERGWRYFLVNKSSKYRIISFIFVFYLGLNFLVTTVSVYNSYIGTFRTSCWKLELPRAKILIPSHNTIGPSQAPFPFKNENEIKELIRHIQSATPHGEPIFIVSQDAMLYFLADRDNPTGYDHINDYYSHIRHQKRIIEDLENKRVKYVVLSNVVYDAIHTCKDGIKNIVPYLYDYIIRHYKFEKQVGFYEFWRRIEFKSMS